MNELIIIAVVVIGLISSIIRASKKARENNIPVPQDHNSDELDPWYELTREEEVTNQSKAIRAIQEDQALTDSAESIEVENIRRNRARDVAKRNESIKKTNAATDKTQVQPDEEQQRGNIADRFNAIDAVIYSEIFKPKF